MESFAANRRNMAESSKTLSNISDEVHSSINTSSKYIDHYNKPTYIDKTLLIKKLFEISEYALITAPKWFGKTLNMDMVRRFVEIEIDSNGVPIVLQRDESTGYLLDNQLISRNFELFKGKKVFEHQEFVSQHFGQYATIFLNFKPVRGSQFEKILVNVRTTINKAFREHAYLKMSSIWEKTGLKKKIFMKYYDSAKCQSLSNAELEYGCRFLSKCLYAHFGKKVYVFIDEFDVPVSHMIYKYKVNICDLMNTIIFLKGLILNLVKNNLAVNRSLFNACHHIGGVLADAASNIIHFPFMNNVAVSEFYGFEEVEVKFLLDKSGLPEYQFTNIRKWYSGYKKTLNDGRTIRIYCPYAVLMYLHEKKLCSYLSVNYLDMILRAMAGSDIRQHILHIMTSRQPLVINYTDYLSSGTINIMEGILCDYFEYDNNANLFFQFLYWNGVFNSFILRLNPLKTQLRIEVPNKAMYSAIDDWIYEPKVIKKLYDHIPDSIDDFTTAMKELAKLRTKSAVINLARCIEGLFPCRLRPHHEFDVHSALYMYLKECYEYTTAECTTSTRTRCDILTVINEVVFIIEFKFSAPCEFDQIYKQNSTCDNSLQTYNQIFTGKYISLLVVEKLREFFNDDKLNFKNKIYLGIYMKYKTVTITFSFDDEVLQESNINVSSAMNK